MLRIVSRDKIKSKNFDRVFTEPSRRVVRNGKLMCLNPKYKEICERDLRTELDHEKMFIDLRETALVEVWCQFELMQNYKEYYSQGMLEHWLMFYTSQLDSIFRSMHRIVYFEELLNTVNPEFVDD